MKCDSMGFRPTLSQSCWRQRNVLLELKYEKKKKRIQRLLNNNKKKDGIRKLRANVVNSNTKKMNKPLRVLLLLIPLNKYSPKKYKNQPFYFL